MKGEEIVLAGARIVLDDAEIADTIRTVDGFIAGVDIGATVG